MLCVRMGFRVSTSHVPAFRSQDMGCVAPRPSSVPPLARARVFIRWSQLCHNRSGPRSKLQSTRGNGGMYMGSRWDGAVSVSHKFPPWNRGKSQEILLSRVWRASILTGAHNGERDRLPKPCVPDRVFLASAVRGSGVRGVVGCVARVEQCGSGHRSSHLRNDDGPKISLADKRVSQFGGHLARESPWPLHPDRVFGLRSRVLLGVVFVFPCGSKLFCGFSPGLEATAKRQTPMME
ncbi:hypothetical protein F5144DRAFT_554532 [Chaetomium tenue]|uniref:Uncharacterized protein n=1 Tax=Chaetomium tenue TaxID=1854479 RepID=A0ACB7PLE9_9PEZI|nr:hypothetical protein F5144DRAFT_554532 [Chaetomium globosum]